METDIWALEVIHYFRVSPQKAQAIIEQVCQSVKGWDKEAKEIGLSRMEQKLMADAFIF